ncbi:MAG TPA: hypothetical protein VND24_11505, partial [Steroidobacteraceae bacterium]|nr:hypothetical protein [Steroidobacteraceae bacterium]
MAACIAGAAPAPAVLETLYRETAGNPLFLCEVVQSLCQDGRDLTDGREIAGRWPIPEGVRQVIGTRLARVSPAAVQILQAGAVLGDGFAFELLAPACALEPAAFLDALDEVVRAGFWREQNEDYHFAHPLIREVLYDELSVPRRQQLHLRAAEAIERISARDPTAHLTALALHYRLAGAWADPEKSIQYAVQAGEAAAAAFAWEDAVAQWQTALRLLKRHGGGPERRAALCERLGALMLASRLDLLQGIGYLEEALTLWRALGDENATARTQVWLGRCYLAHPSEFKDVPRALAFHEAAQTVLDRGPEGMDLGYLYLGLTQAASYLLRSDEALGAGLRALAIGTRLGDAALRSEAATRYANALSRCGRLAEAEAVYEEAWAEADRRELAIICFTVTENRSEHAWDLGDPRAARRICSREL